ncbi:hypothetical protein V8G54_010735 [Vigna mungo]|uniref:Uncharacterized protein n=1 Tax=Vigna mungo TaxID=3915 RepID=A0AAQ3P0M9_VIGMU
MINRYSHHQPIGVASWEFPNQYVIEPTDGSSSGSYLSVSRKDGSIKLIDEISESNTIRVPKIFTIYGVAGMLRLLEGNLVVDGSVRRLERDCLSSSNIVNKFPVLGGCSKCLHSLYSKRWIDLTSLNMMKPIKISSHLTLSSSDSMIEKLTQKRLFSGTSESPAIDCKQAKAGIADEETERDETVYDFVLVKQCYDS